MLFISFSTLGTWPHNEKLCPNILETIFSLQYGQELKKCLQNQNAIYSLFDTYKSSLLKCHQGGILSCVALVDRYFSAFITVCVRKLRTIQGAFISLLTLVDIFYIREYSTTFCLGERHVHFHSNDFSSVWWLWLKKPFLPTLWDSRNCSPRLSSFLFHKGNVSSTC